jgi:hypothetical protein
MLTREKLDECRQLSGTTDRMDMIINIAVIVRYLATPDKRDGRTVRLYRLQHIPNRDYEDEAVIIPKPINLDENVSQDRVVLTHHWMPSYAD